MSTGFKFTVFSLIMVFALAVSQISVGMGSKKKGSQSGGSRLTGATTQQSGRRSPPRSSRGRGTSRTSATGNVVTIKVSKVKGQKLLIAPKPGDVRSLGSLFDLINTNDPQQKRARFQVFVPGNPPSSKSSDNFGLTKEWIEANGNIMVTLKTDDSGIIQTMESMGSFPRESDIEQAKAYGWDEVFRYTRNNFKKILLYFTVPGFDQKFYLIDVWSQTSPIKWNIGFTPEQVCRPYRLLMDWIVD